ncbi:MAG: DUF3422 family protein [Beijerinckiaceae bacterium]
MNAKSDSCTISDHPARAAALSELHARPAPAIHVPAMLCRLVLAARGGVDGMDGPEASVTPIGGQRESTTPGLIKRLCAIFSAPQPEAGARYHIVQCPAGELRWEAHTEFETCTFVSAPGSAGEIGACIGQLKQAAARDHVLLAAMQLDVAAADSHAAEPPVETCVSDIANGRALLETDFRAGPDGLVHYRLTDRGLPPAECGVFAQRILEIETYRMLALIALPLARRVGASVRSIEDELQALTHAIESQPADHPAEALFAQLSRLAARIEADIAATTYRFGAAMAYGAIVEDRLSSLREAPWRNHPQAGRFLMTRLTPALRTCQSMQSALAGLAQRCSRAADLMRTRIDLQLARQNNDLLSALDGRTKLQMRLQQTVEGLSIAALSYYVAGIVYYVFKGAKEAGLIHFDPAIAIAIAIPFIVASVGWTILRIRRMHERGSH